MTSYDDCAEVTDEQDVAAMAMMRNALRALVPDDPPTPSPPLAAALRDGVSTSARTKSRAARHTGRLAGFGLTLKVVLAAGVAAAGIGGAATVASVGRHGGPHHAGVPHRAPSHSGPALAPTPAGRAAPGARPTDSPSPATARPIGMTAPAQSRTGHHDPADGQVMPISPASEPGDRPTVTAVPATADPTTSVSPQPVTATPDTTSGSASETGDSGDGADASPVPSSAAGEDG